MPSVIPAVLAISAVVATSYYAVAVYISCHFFRREHEQGPLLPMTVIRPLRGAEAGLEENLRSVLEADHEGVLQVIFAMETQDDPAYPIAKKLAEQYPRRDVHVVVTGPSGSRMGKIHNMIEALKAATRPVVAFSDSDVRPDRDVLIATSNAFAEGAEAASALPDASQNRAMTDALVGICFNHYFLSSAALLYRAGIMAPIAGGWMVCRKEFIRRMGGLESLENIAADDFAISMAAKRLGAKAVLLPRFAPIYERGGNPFELARHLMKWTRIVRYSAPIPYLTIPIFTPVFAAAAALVAAWTSGASIGLYSAVLAVICLARALLAAIQDRRTAASLFPLWIYPCLPLTDIACVGFWFFGFFSNKIEWRGKKYRLHYGGRLEPLTDN